MNQHAMSAVHYLIGDPRFGEAEVSLRLLEWRVDDGVADDHIAHMHRFQVADLRRPLIAPVNDRSCTRT